jgi:hypothetical protein
MNYYKIKSILHSGRKGDRNSPRTDGRYPMRINRIVEFDVKNITIGVPFILNYIKDENGNDYTGFYLTTSFVKDWDYVYDNVIRIETNNSIYEFKRIEGDMI